MNNVKKPKIEIIKWNKPIPINKLGAGRPRNPFLVKLASAIDRVGKNQCIKINIGNLTETEARRKIQNIRNVSCYYPDKSKAPRLVVRKMDDSVFLVWKI